MSDFLINTIENSAADLLFGIIVLVFFGLIITVVMFLSLAIRGAWRWLFRGSWNRVIVYTERKALRRM